MSHHHRHGKSTKSITNETKHKCSDKTQHVKELLQS